MEYKVYVCTHVEAKVADERMYQLLQTGKAFDNRELVGVQGDDVGDNISIKKDLYDGLLTGMYWIWKNCKSDVKGLCGYRHYFGKDESTPLILEDVQELFEEQQVDFVVLRKVFDESVEKRFMLIHTDFYYHFLHDPLRYIREVVAKECPEYSSAVEKALTENVINYANILIARKQCFDEYCEWLFNILEKYFDYLEEKHYVLPPRFLAYVSERLQRAYLLNQTYKVKELPEAMMAKRNNVQ